MDRYISIQVKIKDKEKVIEAVRKYKEIGSEDATDDSIIRRMEKGIVAYFVPKKDTYVIEQEDLDYITILCEKIDTDFNKFISEELNCISIRVNFNNLKYYEIELYDNGIKKAHIIRDGTRLLDYEEIDKFSLALDLTDEEKANLIEALNYIDILESYGKIENVLKMNLFITYDYIDYKERFRVKEKRKRAGYKEDRK